MKNRFIWSFTLFLISQSLFAQVTVFKGSTIGVNDVGFVSESITMINGPQHLIEITVYKFPKQYIPNKGFEFDIAQWKLSVVQALDRQQGDGYYSDIYVCEDYYSKRKCAAVELKYYTKIDRIDVIVHSYNPVGTYGKFYLEPVCEIHAVEIIN
jgi:hypothetical protein